MIDFTPELRAQALSNLKKYRWLQTPFVPYLIPNDTVLGSIQVGKEVGAVWMPAPQSGNPMTYMLDGRQYIVVAVGGGTYTSEYIAFALPQGEFARPTNEQR